MFLRGLFGFKAAVSLLPLILVGFFIFPPASNARNSKIKKSSNGEATPKIDALSVSSAARSGLIIVKGKNFGDSSKTVVEIGGVEAPFARLSETEIAVYVPESAKPGSQSLKVLSDSVESNSLTINVEQRPAQVGRVRWRFELASSYAEHRPVIGADGTIYVYDVGGFLYAINPNGSLRWIFDVNTMTNGGFYELGPPALGLDGTIYIPASLPNGAGTFPGGIVAVNPDGTKKWQFSQPPALGGRAIIAGPGVGADGNVYAVIDRGGLGVFSITPAGTLRWNDATYFSVQGPLGFEIAFDNARGQFYFQDDQTAGEPQGKLWAYDFNGNRRFSAITTVEGQPVVAPLSGNIYTPLFNLLRAFSPQGNVLWNFAGYPTTNTISEPDAGADDAAYVTINLSSLYAINPNGTERWRLQNKGVMDGPIVSPQNDSIFVGGIITYGERGYFMGVGTDGNRRWRVDLPDENGSGEYGQVRPISRARFAPDGQTAYISADIAGISSNEHRSYFYAVDTTANAPVVPPTVQITSPANGSTVSPPLTDFRIRADAADTDGSVARVDFYSNNGYGWYYLGGDTTAPYDVPFSTPSSGVSDYTLTAQSVDNDGNVSADAAFVSFHINNSGGPLPLPGAPPNILSPSNNQVFPAGSNILISSDRGNASWTISRIEFYADGNLLGSDTTFPYEFNWTNAPAGTYSLTAKAISPTRAPAASAPVSITVLPAQGNRVPSVSFTNPSNGSHFNAATVNLSANATDADGSITSVRFFADGILIGTDSTAPYQINWSGMQRGRNYVLTARATDNENAESSSSPISVFISGNSKSDFDGDGRTDVSIFRPSVGEWWINRSSGGTFAAQFGNSSDKIVPADFTGDGKTDIAIWRPVSGEWFILRSEDFSYYSFPFGASGDIPAPGDFDADGKTDAAVFRPSDSTWYINKSSGGTIIRQFGTSGDVPAVSDYDGDGKSDIAIYRASSGEWWIQKSLDSSVIAFQFGSSTDKPVQGDYTGDGKADIAVWRASTGEWFVLRSEDFSYYSVPFGTNGDIPAPGDFDADGKADFAIFRPSGATWYINRSAQGVYIENFGVGGDIPTSAAY
ncbi:MAG: Ig-like domain-containing protein [Pyrinomonadaceae bacterium]